jgi:hypothetical protein
MIDEDDCGATDGMKIGRGNRNTRRKPAPAPLYPPQIPHDQVRFRTPDRSGGKPATNRLSYGAAEYPCGGGVEYLHRDPASRKRRRNGTKKKAAP